jgi:hypothetical protein
MQHGDVYYITLNCISKNQLTLSWKSRAHTYKQIFPLITELIFFGSVLWWKWYDGDEGDVDFTEGFMKEQKVVGRAYVHVFV